MVIDDVKAMLSHGEQQDKLPFCYAKIEVMAGTIQTLLCSAFEGGSNYWYRIEKKQAPRKYDFRTDHKQIFSHIDYPMNPGGFLLITANGDDERETVNGHSEWKLDQASLERGFQVMAQKYPAHFADAIEEGKSDGTTGDVFLQCCLFGEIIYG